MTGTLTLILLVAVVVINIILIALVLRLSRRRAGEKREQFQAFENLLQRTEKNFLDELLRSIQALRHSQGQAAQGLREEVQNSITRFSNLIHQQITRLSELQQSQYENVRKTVEVQLSQMRAENAKKLDEMRQMVDKELHSTLEKRLGEAFKQVGDRLEKVQVGLGEMQSLAADVGGLKKVLSNVKTRGTLGEMQLERQIDELLTPQQYEKNVNTKKRSRNFVEFAIKLPGQEENGDPVWLPIDSKFPLKTFEQLNDAYADGNKEEIERLSKTLAEEIKRSARDIRDKYLNPPATTRFGIMYLPTEGLYAEVLKIDGLFEQLVHQYDIIPVGPTTFAAFLNSLQIGFRTLMIQKRTSEVWDLLGKVKTDFSKFGDLLEKTKKKLNEAGNVIDDATQRTKSIERRLNKVEELPPEESMRVLEEAS